MVSACNLSYRAGQRYLVNKVTFTQPPGTILAILGANGAGKSTLLKLLCGDIRPSEGTVAYNHKNIAGFSLRQLAHQRAVLAQHNSVTMPLTAGQIVQMGLYNTHHSLPNSQQLQLVHKALDLTASRHLEHQPYGILSGGEQQRVQLARVLAQISGKAGAILFMDEPTNNLDINHQHHIMHTVRTLAAGGLTVVTVLHDINLAARFADFILLMHQGSAVAYGPPLQVITCENIHKTFNIQVNLLPCDGLRCPLVVPAV